MQGPDPRLLAAEERVGGKDHVPSDVNGPMECLDIMALDFRTQMYHAFGRIPTYARWVTDADLTPTYRYERRVLKLLQWGEPVRPWRLKSPAHMLWIDSLVQVFPDARFVMTHRDPTDVILSVCDVYADIAGVFTDDLDRGYIGRLNVEQWSKGIEKVMKFRDDGGDDRFYDIDFRSMQADPIAEVRGLYEWLDRPVSAEFERRMRRLVGCERGEPSAERALRPGDVRPRSRPGEAVVRRLCQPVRPLDLAHLTRGAHVSIDLTGGIDPAREFVFAERPDDPEMRDSVSIWIVDDKGEVGLPRIGIEAVGGHWEEHGLQVNVAFPDGLVFRLRRDGKAWPPIDANRAADRARRRPAGLSLRGAVPHLDHDLRR